MRGRSPVGTGEDYVANVMEAWELGWPKPRVVVLSFPHNPTTATVELADLQRLVDWARERDVVLVHDFAYADVAFDGWQPPSILQCEGAKECAVELYSMTKSFSMAGWRVAFLRRQHRGRRRAGQAEVLPRLRHLPADPDRGDGHDERGGRLPGRGQRGLRVAAQRAGATGWPRIGWEIERPRGTMFAWAPIPEAVRRDGLDRVRRADRQGVRRRRVARASASARPATGSCGSP